MTAQTRSFWAALTACTGIMLALGSIVMVQPIFATIAEEFQLPVVDVRVSFSYCSLTYAVAFFLLGALTDRLPLARLGMWCSLGLGGSVALCALAPNFALFNVGMAATGVFAAGVVSPMFPYMARIAPAGRAGTYLGYCLSATVTGIIFGRTLLGVLTGVVGWRIAILSYGLAIFPVSFALYRMPPLPLLGGARGSIAEHYSRALGLLFIPRIVRRYAAGFLLFFAYLGTLTILTFYLGRPPFDLPVAKIGWISLAGVGGALVAPKAGALAQAYGASRVVRVGVVLVLGSFAIMLLLQSTAAVVAGVLVMYAGVYACQPAVFYDVTTAIQPQQMGAASSLYLLSCLSGGSLGSYTLGIVWQHWGWRGVMASAGAATLGTLVLGTVGGEERTLVSSRA
ncbi:MAG: MFS transporter [Myxococcota bacterium]